MKNAQQIITRQHGRGAFSLIEILVVMAIIALLVGMLMAYIQSSISYANKAATKQTLQAIGTALDVYYNNFNTYPPSRTALLTGAYFNINGHGGQFLSEAMVGWMGYADDGAGPNTQALTESVMGFRITPNGKGVVYGPYLPVTQQNYDSSTNQFRDANGNAIYYYQAQPAINPNGTPRTITQVLDSDTSTTVGLFVAKDNPWTGTTSTGAVDLYQGLNSSEFMKLLGSASGSNTLSPADTIVGKGAYLLVAPDTNGLYFNKNNVVSGK